MTSPNQHTHNSIKLLTLFSVLKMHFSPRENEFGELMMPKLISPHAYDEEDKRQIPNLKPRQNCKGFESFEIFCQYFGRKKKPLGLGQ